MEKYKRNILIVVSIVLLVIVALFFFLYIYINLDKSDKNDLESRQTKNIVIPEEKKGDNNNQGFLGDNINEEEWSEYNHNIFGLSFKYKNSWGEPFVRYLNYLTDLSVIDTEYVEKNLNVDFSDQAFSIAFPNLDDYSSVEISKKLPRDRKLVTKLNNGYLSNKFIGEIRGDDYAYFLNNIVVKQPENQIKEIVKINDNEEPNIATIKRYYNYIALNELSSAYEMFQYKKIDFEKFNEWYQYTIIAKPYDFSVINTNTYRFFVEFQDTNKKPQKYRVTMEVVGNKLNTLSS